MVTLQYHSALDKPDAVFTRQFPDTIFAMRFVVDNQKNIYNISSDNVFFDRVFAMWVQISN